MKRNLLKTLFAGAFLSMLFPLTASADVEINETNFPDENFRNWLLEQSYGTDGVLTEEEIRSTTTINVSQKGISSLEGMEHFTALTYLYCEGNLLTALDVSKNKSLRQLACSNNQLTSLDVSNNTALTSLSCDGNQLTSLDVLTNTALTSLYCDGNLLTSLDVPTNTALKYLSCHDNQLTSLDVSKNTSLTYLHCGSNLLTLLDVSKNTALTSLYCYSNQIKGESMDALISSLPENTAGRGSLYVYYEGADNEGNVMTESQVVAAKEKGWTSRYTSNGSDWYVYDGSSDTPTTDIAIDETNFPDENFRNYLLSQSYGKDGILTESEINTIKGIEVSNKNISSLKGIEYFTALMSLSCSNNLLTSLDVSNNPALVSLVCSNNQLTALDVSGHTALQNLQCINEQLTTLNISGCTSLGALYCNDGKLTTLDASGCTALSYLPCYNNQLTTLNVSGCTALQYLPCYNNQLTTLNVSGCTSLSKLDCYDNQLTTLDVSGCTALTSIDCYHNQIKGEAMDALIDGLPSHTPTTPNSGYRFYVHNNVDLNEGNVCTRTQVAAARVKGWIALCATGQYEGSDDYEEDASGIVINETNFPDANFRNYLYSQDYGMDGVITEEEILGITEINVIFKNINSLKGIEHFTALESLYCYGNLLTSLDVSKNTALIDLDCYGNQLTALDVSNNTALTYLVCHTNQFTTLDVSKNTALTYLDCSHNQFTTMDVSNNTALQILYCSDNLFTTLDVSNNTALAWLSCSDNQLATLDVSNNKALQRLYCYDNQLATLDVSNNTALDLLWCYSNQIAGASMDALVSSLPEGTNGLLQVYYEGAENEGNVMTKSQVTAAKAKGWTPRYTTDGINWQEYEGSDDETSINSNIKADMENAPIYNLNGQRITTTKKGLYIINGKKVIVK